MAAKKGVKKKSTTKKTVTKRTVTRKPSTNTEKLLLDNFVALQKVMVDLSGNFEILNKKITGLLNLFEDSAKALVRRDLDFGKKDDKELMDKLNSVLDQNKLIARGLTLMHDTASNPGSSYTLAPMPPIPKDFSQIKKPRVIEESAKIQPPSSQGIWDSKPKEEELPFEVPKLPENNAPSEEQNAQ